MSSGNSLLARRSGRLVHVLARYALDAYRTMGCMAESFGSLVRRARAQKGWDQAELARRLGTVRQQAVSGWERGSSRPKRAVVAQLADLLGMNEADLLSAAGYPGAAADRPEEIVPPARPLAAALVMDSVLPDDFEQFSAELAMHLHPGAVVRRNGGPGCKQGGVDIIVQFPDGIRDGIQCKREKEFGPAKVREAVGELTMDVRRCYIYLSRRATAKARAEMDKHQGWELLDAVDLSAAVRNLGDQDAAVRLVDSYFPGQREAFLGVRAPTPWLTCDEFFQRESGDRIYSHRWTLAGRSAELKTLQEFLGDPGCRVAQVVGIGGLGKSRLLRELALQGEQQGAWRFRFPARTAQIDASDFERLPPAKGLVVVIDDAHDRAELPVIIEGVWRHRQGAKIILALRPHGLGQLAADLRRAGVHLTELERCELGDLQYVEAEALAREALGPAGNPDVASRLAAAMPDCPLLIAVGAVLVSRGKLNPAVLEADDLIRAEIMSAFREAVTPAPADGASETRHEVLKAVSILQPVRLDEETFRTALTRLTGRGYDQLMPYLRQMEEAGVLARRGDSIRVVPDLLGDMMLAEAALDLKTGSSTGYIDRVLACAEGDCLLHVFMNVSRVDWQYRNGRKVSSSLTRSLWPVVEKTYRAADVSTRLGLLKVMRKVAFFQPARTIGLVRWTIENPAEDEDQSWLSHDDVLEVLAGVLGNAAHHMEHLREAADLLWHLARSDTRPLSRHPEHPIRVLRGLMEYQAGKPAQFQEILINAAAEWLDRDDAAESPHSPFDVLKPALATEGVTIIPDTLAAHFRTYTVNAEAVTSVRGKILDLAFREARHPDIRRAVAAVETISDSLRYPRGMFGRSPEPGEPGPWTPLFADIISRLGELAASPDLHPALGIAVREALSWHVLYSETITRQAAESACNRLPDSPRHNLALILHDGWGDLVPHGATAEESEQIREDRVQAAVTQATSSWPDQQLVTQLEQALSGERSTFGTIGGDADPFVRSLARRHPAIAVEICRRVKDNPGSVLGGIIHAALGPLAETFGDQALTCALSLLATRNSLLARQVAHSFAFGRGSRSALIDGEADLLRELAAHQDPRVRQIIAGGTRTLARQHRILAIELAISIRFSDSRGVTEEVAAVFGPGGFLSWQQLPEVQQRQTMEQLRQSPSINGYQVHVLLAGITRTHPDMVLELFMKRVELAEDDTRFRDSGYEALPLMWHVRPDFKAHPEYPLFLRTVRDWMAASYHPVRRDIGADIFTLISGEHDEQALAILLESAESGDAEQVRLVAAILRRASAGLAWNPDFVRRLLRATSSHGRLYTREVISALEANTLAGGDPSGGHSGPRDQAAQIAASLPAGSAEQSFYRALSEWHAEMAQWTKRSDELIRDRRDW
jgi:transcriptional regulator with XRE-family HTH domain